MNDNATRNDGNASIASTIPAITRAPGNGTKLITTARNVPTTMHPTVEQTAICTVRTNAARNSPDPTTARQVANPPVNDSCATNTNG
ncbi:hypothetical protein GCM10009554_76880 [Kribbella koreensis]|uniref:Uncharacterized protein n=1 Tax=Kribbella koreensis TaxID=57909 RepID=A0ABP4C6B3_9ACTN